MSVWVLIFALSYSLGKNPAEYGPYKDILIDMYIDKCRKS